MKKLHYINKDSIRWRISSYSYRTAISLIISVVFSTILVVTTLYNNFRNFGPKYWNSDGIFSVWWIFGILLGIVAIAALVFFILLMKKTKKLSQLNDKYSSKLNHSLALIFFGLILSANSFLFIFLEAFDAYFLYPRILSLIGLSCLSYGLYSIYKFYDSLKSSEKKIEKQLGSRFLYYSVFAYPIVALVDIIIRVIFKNTLFELYCTAYGCSRRAGNQFYVASTVWNSILLFLVIILACIGILCLFKISKYALKLDDSIDEEFKEIPEISVIDKIGKNIRNSAYSIGFIVLSLSLLHSFYGRYVWNANISFYYDISYMLWAQFIYQAVIAAIFFFAFFIRFISDLRKLSSLNTLFVRGTKSSALILIIGFVLLTAGYFTGLFSYFHEDALYYISNSIILFSFILLFIGFLLIRSFFKCLKEEEMFAGSLFRVSVLNYILVLFSILIIADLIVRTYSTLIFRELMCSNGYCYKGYTAQYYNVLGINNTIVLILIVILTVLFSFGMYLLSKEFNKITLKKSHSQKLKETKSLEEKLSVYSKSFAYSTLISLLSFVLIFLLSYEPILDRIEFNGIFIFPSIIAGITTLIAIVFFILNFTKFYKFIKENTEFRKLNITSLIMLIGSLILILASISTGYEYGYHALYGPSFSATRSVIIIALLVLSFGYIIFLRLLNRIKSSRKRLLLLPMSSISLFVVLLIDLLGKISAWNKVKQMQYGSRILAYENSVKWLFTFDIILIPILIILQTVGFFFLSKDVLLLKQIIQKPKK